MSHGTSKASDEPNITEVPTGQADSEWRNHVAHGSLASTYTDILNDVKADSLRRAQQVDLPQQKSSRTTYNDLIEEAKLRTREISNEKLQAENDILTKNQGLKAVTLKLLFILLFCESLVLFVLTFFQGFGAWGFDLDVVTLRIVVVASLLQISAMLTIAVRHLFPSASK